VKQNDGHVEIYSELDRGTVVKVYLPAAEGEAGPRPKDETLTARNGEGQLVLVVEDEEGVRRITERILRGHGYEVVAAAGPEEALRIASSSAVDVVLTDVVMPGMSGPVLVNRLRESQEQLPAIFMSGYTDRPDSLPRDAAFVSKPFSRQQLLETVARALDHGRETA
jgi:CheY-like chemotaxis protein